MLKSVQATKSPPPLGIQVREPATTTLKRLKRVRSAGRKGNFFFVLVSTTNHHFHRNILRFVHLEWTTIC